MSIIKEGQKVCIRYEAKLETGELVFKTEEEKPLEIEIGKGSIPASIEKALMDMKVGETKTLTLEPDETFGQKKDELIIEIPKEGIKLDKPLEIGARIAMNSPDGKKYVGTVINIKEEKITLDFNNPLAGKNLVFTITLISVI
jgi:peptidylprolyl isomerase